jgi:hypothetical protein
MTPRELIIVMLMPGSIGLVLLLAAWRPWRRAGEAASTERTWWRALLCALALAAGPVAADVLLRGWHGVWPRATIHFLPHVTLIGALAGVILMRLDHRRGLRLALVVLVSGLAAWLATQHRVKNQWSSAEGAGWIIGLASVSAFIWLMADGWLGRQARPGARWSLLVWLAFSACSVLMLFSGAAALSQIAGAFAAASGAFVLLAWWRPELPIVRPTVGVVALALPAIMTLQFYRWPVMGSVPEDEIAWDRVVMTSACMIWLIPSLSALAGEPGLCKSRKPWVRTLVAFIIGLVLAFLAVRGSIPPDKYNPLHIGAEVDEYGY